MLFKILFFKLLLLVWMRFSRTALVYPNTRYFKNSNLTFLSNESLVLQVEGDTVDFFVIADQGGIPEPPYYTHILSYVSNLMKVMAKQENTQFQFALGDNFYFDGVKSVDDERFNTSFESVFDDENLVNTPWFFTLGNHDYRGDVEGNPKAQIEYTQRSKRWILPNQFYDIDIELNSELLMKVFVIDTQLMCDEGAESERHDYVDMVEDKIKFFSNTKAPYFLIMGHYPVWSAGVKGSSECLLYTLRPLMHKYNVNAYFCGDEHVMQHFTDNYLNHTVEYIVSGATNFIDDRPLNIDKVSNETLKFFWQTGEDQTINCENCTGAIVYAKADKSFLSLRYVDTQGREIHKVDIFPRELPKEPSNSASTITSQAYKLFFCFVYLRSLLGLLF